MLRRCCNLGLLGLLMMGVLLACREGYRIRVKSDRHPLSELVEMRATLSDPDAEDPVGTMVFARDTLDIGDVPVGKQVRVEVPFSVEGDAPIVVLQCKAECGCTTPECPKEVFYPQEGGVIPIHLYTDMLDTGAFVKKVELYLHAKPKRRFIYLRGRVYKE